MHIYTHTRTLCKFTVPSFFMPKGIIPREPRSSIADGWKGVRWPESSGSVFKRGLFDQMRTAVLCNPQQKCKKDSWVQKKSGRYLQGSTELKPLPNVLDESKWALHCILHNSKANLIIV